MDKVGSSLIGIQFQSVGQWSYHENVLWCMNHATLEEENDRRQGTNYLKAGFVLELNHN